MPRDVSLPSRAVTPSPGPLQPVRDPSRALRTSAYPSSRSAGGLNDRTPRIAAPCTSSNSTANRTTCKRAGNHDDARSDCPEGAHQVERIRPSGSVRRDDHPLDVTVADRVAGVRHGMIDDVGRHPWRGVLELDMSYAPGVRRVIVLELLAEPRGLVGGAIKGIARLASVPAHAHSPALRSPPQLHESSHAVLQASCTSSRARKQHNRTAREPPSSRAQSPIFRLTGGRALEASTLAD